jgi:hypothetical protein
LRRTCGRRRPARFLEEDVDRVFAALDEHWGRWLAAISDRLADAQVEQVWDTVVAPLQWCASELTGTLWGLFDSLFEVNSPPAATHSADAGDFERVLPVEGSWPLDPWLTAVALAGLLGREWISPAADSAPAEKLSPPRARSRRAGRPSF